MIDHDHVPGEPRVRPLARSRAELWRTCLAACSLVSTLAVLAHVYGLT